MRILDLFRKATGQEVRAAPLSLDERDMPQWPAHVAAARGLDEAFATFQRDLAEILEDVRVSLRPFTDDDILSAVPERARTVNAVHGNEYQQQVQKFLGSVVFRELWTLDRDQELFFDALSAFKDQTSKNVSVLREFLHDELAATGAQLKLLEDRVIQLGKLLEERQFSLVRKLREQVAKYEAYGERSGKYQQLLTSLEADLATTLAKKEKLLADIAQQQALVRNPDALTALERIKAIEDQVHALAMQYASAAQDARAVYKKHAEYKMPQHVKLALDELSKDAALFLPQQAETVQRAFTDIVECFEEERPGNVGKLIERLTRLGASAEGDARTIQTILPDQRVHKRLVMKDIAALQIYDKRQFLMRATTEEEVLTRKISFLRAELDPGTQIAMRSQLRDLARQLGASVVVMEGLQAGPSSPSQQASPSQEAAKQAAQEDEQQDGDEQVPTASEEDETDEENADAKDS